MLSLHVIRECQKKKGTAAFIDAEHALDVSFARRIGVDVDDLIVSQPDSGEQALRAEKERLRCLVTASREAWKKAESSEKTIHRGASAVRSRSIEIPLWVPCRTGGAF